ncbi:MAG: LapA family protein, partial [Aquificaceae bacterium]
MSVIKFLVFIAFLTAFLLFIAQNAGYVEIRFFHMTYNVPLFVLLLFTFAFGFLLPSFYLLIRITILKRQLHGIEEGLRELSRGYLNKAERLLLSVGRVVEPVRSLVAKAIHEQGRLEDLKNFNSTASAIVGEIMLKEGNLQE